MTTRFHPGGTVTRRVALAAALVVLVAADAPAQSAWGLKAGASQASLTGADAGSAASVTGMAAGVFYGIALSDHLALQVEALYLQRGATAFRSDADAPGMPAATLSLSHIEVPVLLRVGFPTETLLLSFFGGPVVSVRVGCTLEPEDGSAGAEACKEPTTTQFFAPRATDIGATAGGGIDLALGESTFFVEARYTLGLLSIQAGEDALEARHATVTAMAGFAFPLGR